MPACCVPDGYAQLFDEKNARSDARNYLKKGLDPTGQRMVDGILRRGVAGASVLEVGGGIGALEIELLRAGAARATNGELEGTYEEAAHDLLENLGLAGRVDRTLLDFARDGGQVARADIVLLHRVICCYPDMESMVRASADHAARLPAFGFPAARWWWPTGALLRLGGLRLR